MSNKKRITVSEIVESINQGCTKDKRHPEYNENVGTLVENFNISRPVLNQLFNDHLEIRKAYLAKFPPKGSGAGGRLKLDQVTIVDDLSDENQEQEQEEAVEEFYD